MSAALPLYAVKAYSIATLILTPTLDGGEWSASCPSCFTPQERAPHYPLNRRLDILEKRNFLSPLGLNPGSSIP